MIRWNITSGSGCATAGAPVARTEPSSRVNDLVYACPVSSWPCTRRTPVTLEVDADRVGEALVEDQRVAPHVDLDLDGLAAGEVESHEGVDRRAVALRSDGTAAPSRARCSTDVDDSTITTPPA